MREPRSVVHFLRKKVQCQMAVHCYPRKPQILKKIDGPTDLTNLAPRLRAKDSRHCAPRTPLLPKAVHHLPEDHGLFLCEVEEVLVVWPECRAHSHDMPRGIQEDPEKTTFFPSRVFPNFLQTFRVHFADFYQTEPYFETLDEKKLLTTDS